MDALYSENGATFVVYESDGTALATNLQSGYKVIATAEDEVTTAAYTVTVDPSSDPRLLSDDYTVSTGISDSETITDVPYDASLAEFTAALYSENGATFVVYESNGTTGATDLQSGYIVIATAEDGVTTATYTVTLNDAPSSDPRLLSITYTVSTGATDSETITGVPYDASLAEFTAALYSENGATFVVYESNGTTLAADLQSGYKVIATAEDEVTTAAYTVTVDPSSDPRLLSDDYIVSTGISDSETITAVPYGTSLVDFMDALYSENGATFVVYESDGTTGATDLQSGYIVIATAEDGVTTAAYTVTVDPEALSSDPRLLSDDYTVSTGMSNSETITGVPYGTFLVEFTAALYSENAATFVVYESNGTTPAADLQSGYKVIATAQNDTDTATYTVTVDSAPASTDSRLFSSVYTVSAGTSESETITGIPCGATLADFGTNVTPADGAYYVITDHNDDQITESDTLLTTGYMVSVTAEDGIHTTAYELTVLPDVVTGNRITSGVYTGYLLGQEAETTYIFTAGGACTRSGPDGMGGTIVTSGTWSYDSGNVLTIETTGTTEITYMSSVIEADIAITETYGAAFTTGDGSTLTFINFKRSAPDHASITGSYTGDDDLCIEITATASVMGFPITISEDTITADTSAVVYNDGTWEGSGVIYTDGEASGSQDISGNWTASDNMLIEFYGDYYLPQVYEDFIFTRQ